MSEREAAPAVAAAEDVHAVTPELVAAVSQALAEARHAEAKTLALDLHAADLADLLEQLPRAQRGHLVSVLARELDPEVLPELEGAVLDDVLAPLSPQDLVAAIAALDTDDAVYLLENLDAGRRETVLRAVPAPDRVAVSEALALPEESAGRLMQRELIAVPQFWTVGQVIDYCRETAELPDDFYEVFLVDPRHKPVGQVALNRLLRAKRPVLMRDIVSEEVHPIPLDRDREEVAFLFKQYRMTSAPVVDADGRLVGVITFDDVAEVIQEEAEEDMLRLSGVSEAGDIHSPVLRTLRDRSLWLGVNLGTAFIASYVIGLFDTTIEKIVALAVLMPIVASMGGNAGMQAVTVTVRAIATKEVTPANALRTVWRETRVGLLNGLLYASVAGVAAGLAFQDRGLGLVIAAAMATNLVVAGLCGTLIPLVLDRLGVDPAVAASVFLTCVTDVVGFLAFLGLATIFLL